MLSAEQIQQNWDKFLGNIQTYINSPRKEQLIEFYKKYEERFVLMPASHKPQYHNSFPGGYIEHVNRVVECSLKLYEIWKQMGTDTSTFTIEELVFSAVNHDLGKFGTEQEATYLEQTDEWRKNKLGEVYMYNDKLEFISVPDRSLYLLLSNNIQFSKNEMLAIKLHDGLYDEANKPYLQNWGPYQKPRTSLIHILHHADMMASYLEFEREWFPKFKKEEQKLKVENPRTYATNIVTKEMGKTKKQIQKEISSKTINNDVLNSFFNK